MLLNKPSTKGRNQIQLSFVVASCLGHFLLGFLIYQAYDLGHFNNDGRKAHPTSYWVAYFSDQHTRQKTDSRLKKPLQHLPQLPQLQSNKSHTVFSSQSPSLQKIDEKPARVAGETAGRDTNSGVVSHEGEGRVGHDYLSQIRQRIQDALEYPALLKRRKVQGKVTVRLVLTPEGELLSSEVTLSSGNSELDRIALQAVQDASPFPKLNEENNKMGKLSLSLPILFQLNPS